MFSCLDKGVHFTPYIAFVGIGYAMPTKAAFGTYIFDLRQAIKKINGLTK